MLNQGEEPAESSPSTLSTTVDIDNLEPLSPTEYTIDRQDNPADGDSAAAYLNPQACSQMDDIGIDFGAEQHAQEMSATEELNTQVAADEQPPGPAEPAGNEDQERRESGTAAGPSHGSAELHISPALTPEDDADDDVPFGGLLRKESLEVDKEGELVQKPNGLAPIRISRDGRPVEAARPPAESPTPGPPTPGTGAAAGLPPPAGTASADRYLHMVNKILGNLCNHSQMISKITQAHQVAQD